jgi:Flp pilus assembly protein TadG
MNRAQNISSRVATRDCVWNLRRRRTRGGSLIELVLVLPILLSLSFGIAEYGYYFYVKNTMLGAARNGARQAILSTATNTTVTSTISSTMTAAGLQNSGYTVTTSPSTVSSVSTGTLITVTVTLNWGTAGVHVLPSWLGGISNSKQLVAVACMNRE